MDLNDVIKIFAALVSIVALLIWVIPTILFTAMGILVDLIILIVYIGIGYIFIRVLEEVFKKGGKNGK